MDVTLRPGCVLVLRHVMRVASAIRRVTDKVRDPENAVAEEQRPYEEERQEPLSLVKRGSKRCLRRPRCSRLPRLRP
jgi:hypothetical protein